MDEAFDAQYKSDRTTQFLFNAFTGLAILISCLGLYGLVSLITLQRTMEIRTAHAIGAPLYRLVAGRCWRRTAAWLIGWAALIAPPLARWVRGNGWRAVPSQSGLPSWVLCASWYFFLLPLTLAVTGYRILRAALANPVDSLVAA